MFFVLKYVHLCCFFMILLHFCRFSLIFINIQIRLYKFDHKKKDMCPSFNLTPILVLYDK